MSGTMQSLSRKIAGAGDLDGVVRAMKALAASSIGQYEKAVQSLDDYYRTLELGLSACLRQAGSTTFLLGKQSNKAGPVGAVIFGSDQGLVGRFNEAIAHFALATLESLPGKTKQIWAVGDRVHSLIADSKAAPVRPLAVPTSVHGITPLIGQLLIEIQAAREKGDVKEVYLFYNHPRSGAIYEPVCKRLLPLDNEWRNKLVKTPWPTKKLPEVIDGPTPALDAFIRGYLFVLLFQACAESLNSENASRLSAMQRAEKNIKQILEDLNLEFHRIRQESIDEELFDVVSGFEALAKHQKRFKTVLALPNSPVAGVHPQ
jgi:F-type H+-transporting ATPase subunit gamma